VLALQRAAGNQSTTLMLRGAAVPPAVGQHADRAAVARAATGAPADPRLATLRREAQRLTGVVEADLAKRQHLHDLNEDQWIVSSIAEFVGGSGELPSALTWLPAKQWIAQVNALVARGDVLAAARALQQAASATAQAHGALQEYHENSLSGAETSTTALEITAAAGAVAATVATGGAAATAGAGLVGTATTIGLGAGAYGVIQEEAGQGGEMLAGTREAGDFDVGAMLKRGGKDAAVGFVGALVGGKLSEIAVNRLGLAAFAQMTPAQLTAAAETLGVEVSALTPQMFVTSGRKLIVDFLSGAAVTPLTTATEVMIEGLTGGNVPESPQVMGELIIENAIRGGLVQGLVAAITHGSAAAGMRSGYAAPPGKPRSRSPANDNVEIPRGGPPANDNALPLPERLAATGTDDAVGSSSRTHLDVVGGGRSPDAARAMGSRGGRGRGRGPRVPFDDEVDPSERASQRNQRERQERANQPKDEPEPAREPDELADELAALEAAQPSPDAIRDRGYKSPEAAIGMLEGKARINQKVRTVDEGLRAQGFRETWYVEGPDGRQRTVLHDPRKGDFAVSHVSSSAK
jgi:hypothetical protein